MSASVPIKLLPSVLPVHVPTPRRRFRRPRLLSPSSILPAGATRSPPCRPPQSRPAWQPPARGPGMPVPLEQPPQTRTAPRKRAPHQQRDGKRRRDEAHRAHTNPVKEGPGVRLTGERPDYHRHHGRRRGHPSGVPHGQPPVGAHPPPKSPSDLNTYYSAAANPIPRPTRRKSGSVPNSLSAKKPSTVKMPRIKINVKPRYRQRA